MSNKRGDATTDDEQSPTQAKAFKMPYVFGSSTPREFSYLDHIPAKYRVYNVKMRVSRRSREEPTLRDFMNEIRNPSPNSRRRDRSVDSASRLFVFGSSTPRELSYLERVPPEFRVYDVKLGSIGNNDRRSKTTASFPCSSNGAQGSKQQQYLRRSSSLSSHIDSSSNSKPPDQQPSNKRRPQQLNNCNAPFTKKAKARNNRTLSVPASIRQHVSTNSQSTDASKRTSRRQNTPPSQEVDVKNEINAEKKSPMDETVRGHRSQSSNKKSTVRQPREKIKSKDKIDVLPSKVLTPETLKNAPEHNAINREEIVERFVNQHFQQRETESAAAAFEIPYNDITTDNALFHEEVVDADNVQFVETEQVPSRVRELEQLNNAVSSGSIVSDQVHQQDLGEMSTVQTTESEQAMDSSEEQSAENSIIEKTYITEAMNNDVYANKEVESELMTYEENQEPNELVNPSEEDFAEENTLENVNLNKAQDDFTVNEGDIMTYDENVQEDHNEEEYEQHVEENEAIAESYNQTSKINEYENEEHEENLHTGNGGSDFVDQTALSETENDSNTEYRHEIEQNEFFVGENKKQVKYPNSTGDEINEEEQNVSEDNDNDEIVDNEETPEEHKYHEEEEFSPNNVEFQTEEKIQENYPDYHHSETIVEGRIHSPYEMEKELMTNEDFETSTHDIGQFNNRNAESHKKSLSDVSDNENNQQEFREYHEIHENNNPESLKLHSLLKHPSLNEDEIFVGHFEADKSLKSFLQEELLNDNEHLKTSNLQENEPFQTIQEVQQQQQQQQQQKTEFEEEPMIHQHSENHQNDFENNKIETTSEQEENNEIFEDLHNTETMSESSNKPEFLHQRQQFLEDENENEYYQTEKIVKIFTDLNKIENEFEKLKDEDQKSHFVESDKDIILDEQQQQHNQYSPEKVTETTHHLFQENPTQFQEQNDEETSVYATDVRNEDVHLNIDENDYSEHSDADASKRANDFVDSEEFVALMNSQTNDQTPENPILHTSHEVNDEIQNDVRNDSAAVATAADDDDDEISKSNFNSINELIMDDTTARAFQSYSSDSNVQVMSENQKDDYSKSSYIEEQILNTMPHAISNLDSKHSTPEHYKELNEEDISDNGSNAVESYNENNDDKGFETDDEREIFKRPAAAAAVTVENFREEFSSSYEVEPKSEASYVKYDNTTAETPEVLAENYSTSDINNAEPVDLNLNLERYQNEFERLYGHEPQPIPYNEQPFIITKPSLSPKSNKNDETDIVKNETNSDLYFYDELEYNVKSLPKYDLLSGLEIGYDYKNESDYSQSNNFNTIDNFAENNLMAEELHTDESFVDKQQQQQQQQQSSYFVENSDSDHLKDNDNKQSLFDKIGLIASGFVERIFDQDQEELLQGIQQANGSKIQRDEKTFSEDKPSEYTVSEEYSANSPEEEDITKSESDMDIDTDSELEKINMQNIHSDQSQFKRQLSTGSSDDFHVNDLVLNLQTDEAVSATKVEDKILENLNNQQLPASNGHHGFHYNTELDELNIKIPETVSSMSKAYDNLESTEGTVLSSSSVSSNEEERITVREKFGSQNSDSSEHFQNIYEQQQQQQQHITHSILPNKDEEDL